MLELKDFDFNLPKNLIAQRPVFPRDACRLMVLDREKKTIKHDKFYNIDKYFESGDILVLNDSKVIPARLWGKKESGGKAEILLLRQINAEKWECLVGSVSKDKQIDLKIFFSAKLSGVIIERKIDTAIIKFNLSGKKLLREIFKTGESPTPPYIKRLAKDKEYQTVYAKRLGSAAAPTAGMHFTKKLLEKIKKRGTKIEFITLHVGLGTFQPVKKENIAEHKMHSEYFELNKKTAEVLNKAKKEGRKIIACGTTSVRVLEHCASQKGYLKARNGETNIFIYPGYKFKFVDQLITNFHTPKSTLLMLISAFADKGFINKAYKEAIEKKYRFYSFGDSMLIL
jgi:S-adenosylmethionine:tRNA ribosyltransferase-isomerase